jgi:DNA-binding transcriptional ArsR family regulator
MVRDPHQTEDAPALQEVLAALDDPVNRTIVKQLDSPMTASEISETCDVPLSTTYRKLEALTEASLLRETVEIRKDGRHTSRYQVDFEALGIRLSDDREFVVYIERPARTTDERLANMWEEVREET